MGAPVKLQGRFSWRRSTGLVLVMAAFALAFSPLGTGFSGGITTEDAAFDPTHGGCTASGCHGGEAFAAEPYIWEIVTVTFTDAEGGALSGAYEHGATYTLTITLDEQVATDGGAAGNHAGFNLFADGGSFEAVDDTARVTDAGDEATHTDGSSTEWNVAWTAPEEGPVTFRLFVNDVDGSGSPDEPDDVYFGIFSVTDEEFALPGAVQEEEAHVGVPLPQYWLGLLALAGMAFILIFGFVYLKYVSPHNTDHKDR